MQSIVAANQGAAANFRSCADSRRALSWWVPPAARAAIVQRADQTAAGESENGRRDALYVFWHEALEAGLRHRVGRFLVGVDRAVYDYISGRCSDRPRGVSVCELCSQVFAHAYAVRSRCDSCHARPHRRAPGVSSDDAGAVIADPAEGAILFRLAICEHCAARFEPQRPARFCSDACRKRHGRGLPPPEDSLAAPSHVAAVAEVKRWLAAAQREQDGAERRDPALRAARIAAQREAYGQVWAQLAASPIAEQLTASGTLID